MRIALLVALTGCSSIFGLHAPQRLDASGAGGGDADATSHDGPLADAQACFGSGKYTVCFTTLPTAAAQVSGTVNTSTAACSTDVHWADSSQPDACFIVGTQIAVTATTVTGTPPLVLVATDAISFEGLVNLSSHRLQGTSGAGAVTTCVAPTAATENINGGGGGAGGTLATRGGNGGTGRPGATGAVAAAIAAFTTLHGGCVGTIGARGGGGGNGGQPGNGGGALYAVAGATITLGSATIAANGAGAGFPGPRWGGGGGGSGGMIVLYAPVITSSGATLVANGGGGAGGADSSSPGGEPDPQAPTVPAAGGASTSGGTGGPGYALGAPAGDGIDSTGTNTGGGGGGGGGAGYIQMNISITTDVTASPAITVVP